VMAASFWTPTHPVHRRWIAWSSDATYGLYLIHPIVFFDLKGVVLPLMHEWRADLGTTLPAVVFALLVIALSAGLALLSEYWLERPLRSQCRRWLNA
jgi:peptidoglycan/LPS O-acetylase OafA/YrhL